MDDIRITTCIFLYLTIPVCCANCTEKPVAAAVHNSLGSHMLVHLITIEANAFARKSITIAASITCVKIIVSCAELQHT